MYITIILILHFNLKQIQNILIENNSKGQKLIHQVGFIFQTDYI